MSGISETSKKSKRQGALKKQQKQKLRKKRQVKEGSPYEEDFLIGQLQDEVRVTAADKEEVRDIIKALLNFGMIAESTDIHSLVERVLRAQYQVSLIRSVEQELFLEKANSMQLGVQGMFPEFFDKHKKEEDHQKVLAEWKDVKFFKH
jgi:CRISPR/Cas system-associated protein Cas5 (RAMP superfamily)